MFAGLPGTAKTGVARELARRLVAVHARIDSIQQAIRGFLPTGRTLDAARYRTGHAIAAGNLRIGQDGDRGLGESARPDAERLD